MFFSTHQRSAFVQVCLLSALALGQTSGANVLLSSHDSRGQGLDASYESFLNDQLSNFGRELEELLGGDEVAMALSHDHVARINSDPSLPWKAHMSPRFMGASLDDAKALCGTIMDSDYMITLPHKSEVLAGDALGRDGLNDDEGELPKNFDSREHWPECRSVIGHVRDQSKCGSCWAFGATEAFNGRLCIATKGKMNKLLSPGEITSCCGLKECMSMGCNGGQPGGAWNFFRRHGVVTGGDADEIGTGKSCYPYQFESCSHHIKDPNRTPCEQSLFHTPKCQRSCPEKNYPTPFQQDRHFASKVYSLSTDENEIMRDIYNHGPVTAAFMVRQDFLMYRSGVYKHSEKSPQVGGHAIVIIGWGVDEESGTPYWLCINSWNSAWGEKGLFRMLRGQNECGIESMIVTGLAQTTSYGASEDDSY